MINTLKEIEMDGKRFFVDERLKEIRETTNPYYNIPFCELTEPQKCIVFGYEPFEVISLETEAVFECLKMNYSVYKKRFYAISEAEREMTEKYLNDKDIVCELCQDYFTEYAIFNDPKVYYFPEIGTVICEKCFTQNFKIKKEK